jgi:PAS domain S-box-containing protein
MAAPERAGRPVANDAVEQVLAQLAEIETTTEELRVVEDALRVQQHQVQQLLSRYEAEHRWRTHLSALVPIGLTVTDGHGKLVEANPALAVQLGVGLHRLRGKPLSVYLHPDDVRGFRAALRELATGLSTEHRTAVRLRPRGRDAEPAELFGFTEVVDPSPETARVQWVLVPAHPPVAAAGPPGAATPGTADEPDTADLAGTADLVDTADRADTADVVGAVDAPEATESIALAAALAQMSSLPVGESDQQRLLSRMAALVRSAVPAAEWVSVTLGSPRDPQRLGSDSPEAQTFDGLQVQVDEGPCADAYASGHVVVSGDVTADERWPHLAKRSLDGRVRSVLALPVLENGAGTGVVNVYSGHRHAFGPSNRQIAELVAAAVAGVLQTVAERESLQVLASHLEQALTSRAVIDQAKGVLMAHLAVSADEAFARLVTLSSRLNVKVRDLARLVVEGDAATVLAALRL